MSKHVGDFEVVCGLCENSLVVPIYAELITDETTEQDGTLRVFSYPDVSEVWLHGWSEHPEKFNE